MSMIVPNRAIPDPRGLVALRANLADLDEKIAQARESGVEIGNDVIALRNQIADGVAEIEAAFENVRKVVSGAVERFRWQLVESLCAGSAAVAFVGDDAFARTSDATQRDAFDTITAALRSLAQQVARESEGVKAE
jgi:hypothetical protein